MLCGSLFQTAGSWFVAFFLSANTSDVFSCSPHIRPASASLPKLAGSCHRSTFAKIVVDGNGGCTAAV